MTSAACEPAWLEQTDAPLRFVLTVCCDDDLDAALAAARAEVDDPRTLVERPGEGAYHLGFERKPRDAWDLLQRLREHLDEADVYLQPRDEFGKQLLICDMDMTIVAAETLDEVAAGFGLGDEIAAITRRAMYGEIDFRAALRERIAMLAGEAEQIFLDVNARLSLNRGARRLLAGAKAAGVRTILVSGGFAQVADEVARQLGFDEVYCNHLEIRDGKLTGEVREPIVDAELKQRVLRQRAQACGLSLRSCCAIGDGANDIPMLTTAGLGIGFRPKPILRAATSCHIDATSLASALHFMGLKSPG